MPRLSHESVTMPRRWKCAAENDVHERSAGPAPWANAIAGRRPEPGGIVNVQASGPPGPARRTSSGRSATRVAGSPRHVAAVAANVASPTVGVRSDSPAPIA
jgi:hypothetical protein